MRSPFPLSSGWDTSLPCCCCRSLVTEPSFQFHSCAQCAEVLNRPSTCFHVVNKKRQKKLWLWILIIWVPNGTRHPFSLQNKLLSGCFGIFADLVSQFLRFAGSHSCFTACSNLQQCWFIQSKHSKHSKHCKCCGCVSRFENEHQRALSLPHLSPEFENYAGVSFFDKCSFSFNGWRLTACIRKQSIGSPKLRRSSALV